MQIESKRRTQKARFSIRWKPYKAVGFCVQSGENGGIKHVEKRMLIVLGMAAVLCSWWGATVQKKIQRQMNLETETTDESVTENDSTEENGEETAEADAAEEETPEIQEGYTD